MKLQNYNSSRWILAGIRGGLDTSFDNLDDNFKQKLSSIERIFIDVNEYRNILKGISGTPAIPDMNDVLFKISNVSLSVDNGDDDGLIDFRKCKKIALIISDIRKYQQTPYSRLESSLSFQNWLTQLHIHINHTKGFRESKFNISYRDFSRSLIATQRIKCKEDFEGRFPSLSVGGEVTFLICIFFIFVI